MKVIMPPSNNRNHDVSSLGMDNIVLTPCHPSFDRSGGARRGCSNVICSVWWGMGEMARNEKRRQKSLPTNEKDKEKVWNSARMERLKRVKR